jgi:HSP20 family protein
MARNPLSPYRTGGLAGGGISDPFLSMHREMNRLFDDVLRGSLGPSQGEPSSHSGMLTPHIDVSETDSEVRICAELPGVKDEDIDVSLDDDVLTIRGEKKFERKDDKENYHFIERSYGSFQRSLRLPYSVNPDEVKAQVENGVLTVTVPKSQQQVRSRRIQIQKGGSSQTVQPDTMQGVPPEGQRKQSKP